MVSTFKIIIFDSCFVFSAILQETTLEALLSSSLASILESCKACIKSTRVTT